MRALGSLTILLLYMYQVFIFLQDHLHFFLHFFFTFMEQLFLDDPILHCSKHITARHGVVDTGSHAIALGGRKDSVFQYIT